ncbi:MAG: AAA family ATPase [Phormidium sp. GEM2.Bin31]|nr:AAA family ATPase [Phormidium sp. BM_Day4_Bin.17]TVR08463.1 MAG: AAA family ATPase [Phormidium sp. GEM2.Bin31]UCJ13208.1 MAG: AAA family ATPase [Phormidium sp. PBR-2020]
MKIESIFIDKFKRFDELFISFENKSLGEVSDRFLILGDNGTGKTTILQAIALPLALATKTISDLSEFSWSGFLASRYYQWGIPNIDVEVSFSSQELEATQQIAQLWYDSFPRKFRPPNFVIPGKSQQLKISLYGEYWRVGEENSLEERTQLLGRYYARQLVKIARQDSSIWQHFSLSDFFTLPGIFWFDQFRNLSSNTEPNNQDFSEQNHQSNLPNTGVSQYREYLLDWSERQKRIIDPNHPQNYLGVLEHLYQTVFSDRSIQGAEPLRNPGNSSEVQNFFLFSDGQKDYDIAEMSAGEQSVLPIFYTMVRQHIANSIVLIDEIDLNLHPPLAQTLTSQLLKLCDNCQFIITTHSDAVNDIVGEDDTYRLPGGSLCL